MTGARVHFSVGSEGWRLDLFAEIRRIMRRHPEWSVAALTRREHPALDAPIPYPARSPEYQRIWRERHPRRRAV